MPGCKRLKNNCAILDSVLTGPTKAARFYNYSTDNASSLCLIYLWKSIRSSYSQQQHGTASARIRDLEMSIIATELIIYFMSFGYPDAYCHLISPSVKRIGKYNS